MQFIELLNSVETSVFNATRIDCNLVKSSYPALGTVRCIDGSVHISNYDISGQGEPSTPLCGQVTGADYCFNDKYLKLHRKHCDDNHCPVCYQHPASKGGKRIADKLVGIQKSVYESGGQLGYLNHLEISAPESVYSQFDFSTVDGYKAFRKQVSEYAQMIGCEGGSLVIHEVRGLDKETKIKVLDELRKNGDESPRFWKGVIKNVLSLASWRDYAKPGYHGHIIAFFKMKMTSDEFCQITNGWTYKNITVDRCRRAKQPIKPENYESVKIIGSYELTHRPLIKGVLGVTYFGICQNGRWKTEASTTFEFRKCPKCESDLYKISFESEGELNSILGGEKLPTVDEFTRKSVDKVKRVKYFPRKELKPMPKIEELKKRYQESMSYDEWKKSLLEGFKESCIPGEFNKIRHRVHNDGVISNNRADLGTTEEIIRKRAWITGINLR